MEIGLDFDDTDFTEKPKDIPLLTSYNAKICCPKWFLSEEAERDETNDKATLFKFKGDYFYRQTNYEAAIQAYKISLDSLGSQNRTMRREMTEALGRCYVQTERFSEAYETAMKMTSDCLTVDQMCQALLLHRLIYRQAGCIKQELLVTQQLVEAHPFNSQFWQMLAEVYQRINSWMDKHSYHPSCHGNLCNQEIDPRSDNVGQVTDSSFTIVSSEQIVNCSTLAKQHSGDLTSNTVPPIEKLSTDTCPSTDIGVEESAGLQPEMSVQICDKLLTGYSCHLMQLTCHIRIKLILQSVHDTVGTFIKERNTALLTKVEEKIQSLTSSEEIIHKATENILVSRTPRNLFMKDDMFEDSFCGGDAHKEESEVKWAADKTLSIQDFNKKWFSWTKDLPH